MAKEYTVRPKHRIGKTVYIVDKDSYGQKKPKVYVGTVVQINAIIDAEGYTGEEPVLQYRVKFADSYRDETNYHEFQLLAKSEAERRYQQFSNDLKTFDDIYLKTMLQKAEQLIKAYKR